MKVKQFKDFIYLLKNNKLTDYQDSYQAFNMIVDNKVNAEEVKEFLILINKIGINKALLFGAAKSLNERSIKIKAPKNSIDVCGTGGDNINSLNISTAVAIIIASMGIPVAKHGNRAVSSMSGSADIFSQLGINLNKNKEQIEKSLEQNNLAFIFAPIYHPALKNVAHIRKELGTRTIFNFLGPLLNPAQTKIQLIGCSDKNIAKIMLETCIFLKKEKCMTVTGLDGMDEISISSNTIIYAMNKNRSLRKKIFNPEEYGIKKRSSNLIKGQDPEYNAKQLIKLLKGDIFDKKLQAYFDIVTLNCAAALIISGNSQNFSDAIRDVQRQIKSGKSYQFLSRIVD